MTIWVLGFDVDIEGSFIGSISLWNFGSKIKRIFLEVIHASLSSHKGISGIGVSGLISKVNAYKSWKLMLKNKT